MASFPPITMTTEGLNMIAKASSGNIEDRLIITKVKLGDGISTGNIRDYTDVISSKKEVTLSNWENRGDGRFRYTFVYNNEGVKIGFYHREIGLFAKSGNDGAERLIAYTNAGSYPGYIDDETNKIPYQSLMINIGVGDTDNVSGEVDVSNAITIEMLNEHKNDENAHSNLIKNIFGIEEVTEGNIKEKIEEYAKKVCLPLSGGTMEGLVSLFTGSTIPTPTQQDNSKKITNTEWVQTWVKDFVAELSNNIEVEIQEDGHFSCPALGITGLMAQNGYICLGKLFGNLVLQWGYCSFDTIYIETEQQQIIVLPIQANNRIPISTINCGNVEYWSQASPSLGINSNYLRVWNKGTQNKPIPPGLQIRWLFLCY